jgi:hypothetical protein
VAAILLIVVVAVVEALILTVEVEAADSALEHFLSSAYTRWRS